MFMVIWIKQCLPIAIIDPNDRLSQVFSTVDYKKCLGNKLFDQTSIVGLNDCM